MRLSKSIKFLFSLLISGIFLFLIYRKIDYRELVRSFSTVNWYFFGIYLILFIPQLAIAAFRWKYILHRINGYGINYMHAFQMITGSYTANLIVPAKMGEVVRVFWVDKNRSRYSPLLVVLFEKLWDILAVYLILYISLFFITGSDTKYS
ncbi:MAG: lysylphosphatidylglycerol synthase transmembrane domain-containing protein, partial [Bacteroidales bacterium]